MLAKYFRVYWGSYLGNKKDRQVTPMCMLWVSLIVGLVLSLHAAIQGLLWASEVVRGDRSDLDNPFRWDKIRFNLPGDPSYLPTITWMSKIWGGWAQELAVYFTT